MAPNHARSVPEQPMGNGYGRKINSPSIPEVDQLTEWGHVSAVDCLNVEASSATGGQRDPAGLGVVIVRGDCNLKN